MEGSGYKTVISAGDMLQVWNTTSPDLWRHVVPKFVLYRERDIIIIAYECTIDVGHKTINTLGYVADFKLQLGRRNIWVLQLWPVI